MLGLAQEKHERGDREVAIHGPESVSIRRHLMMSKKVIDVEGEKSHGYLLIFKDSWRSEQSEERVRSLVRHEWQLLWR